MSSDRLEHGHAAAKMLHVFGVEHAEVIWGPHDRNDGGDDRTRLLCMVESSKALGGHEKGRRSPNNSTAPVTTNESSSSLLS